MIFLFIRSSSWCKDFRAKHLNEWSAKPSSGVSSSQILHMEEPSTFFLNSIHFLMTSKFLKSIFLRFQYASLSEWSTFSTQVVSCCKSLFRSNLPLEDSSRRTVRLMRHRSDRGSRFSQLPHNFLSSVDNLAIFLTGSLNRFRLKVTLVVVSSPWKFIFGVSFGLVSVSLRTRFVCLRSGLSVSCTTGGVKCFVNATNNSDGEYWWLSRCVSGRCSSAMWSS